MRFWYSYIVFNTPGLKINGHAQGTPSIGHAQCTQSNTPCKFSQVLWSMLREHHCLRMYIEPPRTHIRCWISFLPQTWWSPIVGWMKASLNSTKVLFQRIYQLLVIQQNEKSTQQIKLVVFKSAISKYPYTSILQYFNGFCLTCLSSSY